jgi:hypothetical protein
VLSFALLELKSADQMILASYGQINGRLKRLNVDAWGDVEQNNQKYPTSVSARRGLGHE